ncbi:MAG: hypothetical protein MI924_17355 [Chloroflexales bacterium]|nr:hypothetical protein [Chloroflexales bacterium]
MPQLAVSLFVRNNYPKLSIELCNTTVVSSQALNLARRQIAEVHYECTRANDDTPTETPLVVDLFAGGGSIPLEALRLGCTTLAGDLNPVAYLIELCTLVYPQRYPELAAQVSYWGKRLLKQVQHTVSDAFPPVTMKQHPDTTTAQLPLQQAEYTDSARTPGVVPSAYIWTHTVTCPNPHCGATVPLTTNTWLVNKPKKPVVALRIEPTADRQGVQFIRHEAPTCDMLGFTPDGLGTRGHTRCVCSGATVDNTHVKRQGKAGNLAVQLMAVVFHDPVHHKRHYMAAADLSPDALPLRQTLDARIARLCAETGLTVPDEQIYSGDSRAFFTHLYGFDRFGDLFTRRQLLVLLTFADQLRKLHQAMLAEGLDAEQARAIASYLGLLINRLADWNSTICKWAPTSEAISNTFARQALPMMWNFVEMYPFGIGWGNLPDALDSDGGNDSGALACPGCRPGDSRASA